MSIKNKTEPLAENIEEAGQEMQKIAQTKKPFFRRFWWIFAIAAIVIAISLIFILRTNKKDSLTNAFTNQNNNLQTTGRWTQTMDGWKAEGSVPSCPSPLELSSITDLNLATSVLYPGQMRSVGYEPTAGFRFDKSDNDTVTIVSPIDGEIVQASRFLERGETQYVFDIMMPCGIMVRFDHLLIIPQKLQDVANKLPEPKENDSRSTFVSPPIKISKGETIATGVGIRKNKNTFISWTMYDFRTKNKISQNAIWAKEHPEKLYHYVICPFPYLPQKDQEIIKKLPPADSMSGSKSDFCN